MVEGGEETGAPDQGWEELGGGVSAALYWSGAATAVNSLGRKTGQGVGRQVSVLLNHVVWLRVLLGLVWCIRGPGRERRMTV